MVAMTKSKESLAPFDSGEPDKRYNTFGSLGAIRQTALASP